MITFVVARNFVINVVAGCLIVICIFIPCCSADYENELHMKYNSSDCSVVLRVNGSAAQVDLVYNASMGMLRVWNTFGLVKSQNVSDCNSVLLDLQLLNSNMSFHSDLSGIYIQSMQLLASRIKLQNGTFIFRSSVLVPESSIMELDHATLAAATNSPQILLTIQGTLMFL